MPKSDGRYVVHIRWADRDREGRPGRDADGDQAGRDRGLADAHVARHRDQAREERRGGRDEQRRPVGDRRDASPRPGSSRQSAVIISESRLVPKRPSARGGALGDDLQRVPEAAQHRQQLAPELGDQRDGDRREHQHHHEQHDDPVEVVGSGELHVLGQALREQDGDQHHEDVGDRRRERVQAGGGDRDGRSLAVPAEERRVERDPAERGRDRQADRLDGVLEVHQRDQRQPGLHRRERGPGVGDGRELADGEADHDPRPGALLPRRPDRSTSRG